MPNKLTHKEYNYEFNYLTPPTQTTQQWVNYQIKNERNNYIIEKKVSDEKKELIIKKRHVK